MSEEHGALGVIGVGAIAEAIVDGLCARPDPGRIVLSPRGADTAAALSSRYADVEVAADNQGVADAADTLLLCVPPSAVTAALDGLRLRGDTVLISAVAGWTRGALAERLDAPVTIVRSIPLPAVREHQGVTALYPEHPVARALFEALGTVVIPPSEDDFRLLSTASATASAQLAYLTEVAGWLEGHGMPADDAQHFVRGVFAGLAGAVAGSSTPLAQLPAHHETPAGLNEQFRSTYFDERTRARLHEALDAVLERLEPQSDSS